MEKQKIGKIENLINKTEFIEEKLKNALIDCLNQAGIKVNPELEYDHFIERDYYELLEAFENHLKMVENINSEYDEVKE